MNATQVGSFLFALGRSSVEAGVVVALVWAAQGMFRARLSPRWRATLWLLVVARLLLPFSFSSMTSIFNYLPHWTPQSHSSAVVEASASPPEVKSPKLLSNSAVFRAAPMTPNPSKPERAWPWQYWVLAVWLGGAAFLTRRVVVASLAFRKHCARLRPCMAAVALSVFTECCERFKIKSPPALLESGSIGSPALHGLFRPRLLLPKGFAEQFSPVEMRYIFLHELAHLQRHDLALNWVMAALQAAHWFNPLIWFGFARWRADRELACDAIALEIAGPTENRDYGRTILHLMELVAPPVSSPTVVGILEEKSQLHRRIDMIANYVPARGWPRLTLLLTVGLAAVGLTDAQTQPSDLSAGTTPITDQAQLSQDLVGTWILVGEPGHIGEAPSAGGRYKFFTGSQWCITEADAKTGVVIFHHGGSYKIEGSEYIETVEYANPTTIAHIGHTGRFKMSISGDTLTDIGQDNPWREVWKRAPSKADPSSSLAKGLVGTWVKEMSADEKKENPTSKPPLKLIADSCWCDTESDAKTGVVVAHHGGDLTLKGNRYVEHVKYANPSTMPLIGHSFKFDLQLDGDTLRLTGIDNPWNETWKRVK
jgi:beta-lactamase regulating signal transducer with metallopeptidase domain